MLFYRVCHRNLLNCPKDMPDFYSGPYTCGDPTEEWPEELQDELLRMSNEHSRDDEHPSVALEWGIGRALRCDFLCGFTSPEKLLKWFDGWLETLYEADYVVRVWNIPSDLVEEGSVQSLASLDYLALIRPTETISLDEFEKRYGKVAA